MIQRYRIVVDGSPFPRVTSDAGGDLCLSVDVLAIEQKLANADALLRKAREVSTAYTSRLVTQDISDTADVLLMGIDAHLKP